MRTLYFRPYPQGFAPATTPAVDAQRLYLVAAGVPTIVAADIAQGTERWRVPELGVDLGPMHMVVRGGTLFYALKDAVARDAATGAERWRVRLPANAVAGVHAATDSTFIVASGRTLRALRIADGTAQWVTTISPDSVARDWIALGSTLAGGVLYAVWIEYPVNLGLPSTGHLVALDPQSGEIIWHRTTPGGTPASPPSVWGAVLLYPELAASKVVAVHRNTAEALYSIPNVDPTFAGGFHAPSLVGDTAFAGSGDGYVTAFLAPTGEILWRTPLGTSIQNVEPCGSVLLVLGAGLTVLHRGTGAVLRRVANADWGRDRELNTHWARQGNRAYAGTPAELVGVRCPR